jgi:hypothetical protein
MPRGARAVAITPPRAWGWPTRARRLRCRPSALGRPLKPAYAVSRGSPASARLAAPPPTIPSSRPTPASRASRTARRLHASQLFGPRGGWQHAWRMPSRTRSPHAVAGEPAALWPHGTPERRRSRVARTLTPGAGIRIRPAIPPPRRAARGPHPTARRAGPAHRGPPRARGPPTAWHRARPPEPPSAQAAAAWADTPLVRRPAASCRPATMCAPRTRRGMEAQHAGARKSHVQG